MDVFPPTLQTIAGARRGDARSRRALLRSVAGWLPGAVARRYGAHLDPEDLCQDVLLQVHLGIAKLRDERRFLGWLHSVLRNRAALRLKRLQRRRVEPCADVEALPGAWQGAPPSPACAESPEQGAALREAWRRGQAAVDALEPSLREVYLLRLEERSQSEIAQLLEIPRGTVASRLRRARAQVRAELAGLSAPLSAEDSPLPEVAHAHES